jgi:hypothetical protein
MRILDCVPPPHVAVHSEYGCQSWTTQSIGQSIVLHSVTSSQPGFVGHSFPPLSAAVRFRIRRFVPPPHCSLHSEKAPHSPITQSTGWSVGSGVGAAVGSGGVGCGVGRAVGHASL